MILDRQFYSHALSYEFALLVFFNIHVMIVNNWLFSVISSIKLSKVFLVSFFII